MAYTRPRRRSALLVVVPVLVFGLAGCTAPATRAEPPLVTVVAPLAPLAVLAAAVATSTSDTSTAGTVPSLAVVQPAEFLPEVPSELPRGGREIFPTYEVIAHYGTATTAVLGVLGEGTPEQAGRNLLKAAEPFGKASGRRILPAFELIVSVAQRSPGDDGDYSSYLADAEIDRYLAEARKIKALVILDLQPGLADPLVQAKHFAKYLSQPDVGLALDPEWKLYGNQKPGRQIGYLTPASINEVSAWVADLRGRLDLPEKLFVLHQFQTRMIPNRETVVARPGLATVIHVDGFGTRGVKKDTYAALALPPGGPLHNGFKLFIDEDIAMFNPVEAMALRPSPELITYQ